VKAVLKPVAEGERFRRYIGSSLEVANALRGPQIRVLRVPRANRVSRRLTSRGFGITVPEPYTVTLERGVGGTYVAGISRGLR